MTRNELLNMNADDLAKTLNELLKNYESKNKLFKTFELKKQVIDKKLMQAGYSYNNDTKCYSKSNSTDTDQVALQSDLKIADDSKEIINDLIIRMERVESRLNAIESNKSSDFELVKFESTMQNKNYRLYKEVTDLIDMIKRDHKHLNITQVVNSALYRELSKLKK